MTYSSVMLLKQKLPSCFSQPNTQFCNLLQCWHINYKIEKLIELQILIQIQLEDNFSLRILLM